jgi:hypothetical protein
MTSSNPKAENPASTGQSIAPGTGSPLAVGNAAIQSWMDMSTEAVRFVWDRLQQDIKTQQAMLACTNLEQIQKVQAEFFKSAQDQYAAEARKMLAMIGQATTAGMATSTLARKYDDVPL